jgi:hypothetical protein
LETLSIQLNLLRILEICKHMNLIQIKSLEKVKVCFFIWATTNWPTGAWARSPNSKQGKGGGGLPWWLGSGAAGSKKGARVATACGELNL